MRAEQKAGFNQWIDRLCVAALVFLWCYSVVNYFLLPDHIPIHFGEDGRIDDWGRKATIYLFPLGASIVVFMTMQTGSWLRNSLRFVFHGIELAALFLFGSACVVLVQAGRKELDVFPGWILPVSIGILGIFVVVAAADFVKKEFEKADGKG